MTSHYMPYFREGRLYLPQATRQLLIESGFDTELVHRAGQGLYLDEDRQYINNIRQHIQAIANTLDPAVQAILTSNDVEFMLSYS